MVEELQHVHAVHRKVAKTCIPSLISKLVSLLTRTSAWRDHCEVPTSVPKTLFDDILAVQGGQRLDRWECVHS